MLRKSNHPATIHFIDGSSVQFSSVHIAYDNEHRPAYLWATYGDGKQECSIPFTAIKMIAQT